MSGSSKGTPWTLVAGCRQLRHTKGLPFGAAGFDSGGWISFQGLVSRIRYDFGKPRVSAPPRREDTAYLIPWCLLRLCSSDGSTRASTQGKGRRGKGGTSRLGGSAPVEKLRFQVCALVPTKLEGGGPVPPPPISPPGVTCLRCVQSLGTPSRMLRAGGAGDA